MKSLLQRYFGYDEFRPLQEDIIGAVMDGDDALVLMPTGGGKSLCYQLPALALPGVTLVVSPLIALMKDQVDALRESGVPAGFVNSSQSREERLAIQKAAYYGEIKLLYVAPERVAMAGFQRFVAAANVSLIAVDEAHCISQWGHEFRPDYRALSRLREAAPDTPIIALTATATRRVRDDIAQQLNMAEPRVFVASFDRPNLRYSVLPDTDRYDRLLQWLTANPNASAIVYRSSRSGVDSMVEDLRDDGVSALPYHAGLEPDVRAANQERFVRDESPVIVATVAFGMGIDKPDVRLVMHYETPDSVERYYQESGRAGRDGLESECVLFYGPRERERLEYLLNQRDAHRDAHRDDGTHRRRPASARRHSRLLPASDLPPSRAAELLRRSARLAGLRQLRRMLSRNLRRHRNLPENTVRRHSRRRTLRLHLHSSGAQRRRQRPDARARPPAPVRIRHRGRLHPRRPPRDNDQPRRQGPPAAGRRIPNPVRNPPGPRLPTRPRRHPTCPPPRQAPLPPAPVAPSPPR